MEDHEYRANRETVAWVARACSSVRWTKASRLVSRRARVARDAYGYRLGMPAVLRPNGYFDHIQVLLASSESSACPAARAR